MSDDDILESLASVTPTPATKNQWKAPVAPAPTVTTQSGRPAPFRGISKMAGSVRQKDLTYYNFSSTEALVTNPSTGDAAIIPAGATMSLPVGYVHYDERKVRLRATR